MNDETYRIIFQSGFGLTDAEAAALLLLSRSAGAPSARDELAGLASLPALLARVNPDEVSRICADDAVAPATGDEPPRELIGTVLNLAEARRRRTRLWALRSRKPA